MKPTPRTSTPLTIEHTTESSSELEAQIRSRAYELYEKRGKDDGHDLDDWLQAESEVTWKPMAAA
jgi:Protein of unknown function (DUF2934)